MPFIGESPWADAANYGAGLGRTLTQGIYEQPRQRYELQMQLGQMAQQQKQQALMNFLAQQRLQEQQQVGQSTIHRNEAMAKHYENPTVKPQSSKWTYIKDANFLLDQNTGEIKPVNLGGQGGLGSMGHLEKPPTGNEALRADLSLAKFWPMLQSAGLTNNPAMNSSVSNLTMQALGKLGQRYQAPQAMPMQMLPQRTNAPVGLGGVTNPPPQRVLQFNPATGQLE